MDDASPAQRALRPGSCRGRDGRAGHGTGLLLSPRVEPDRRAIAAVGSRLGVEILGPPPALG
jgi:hypothetical protein